MNAAEMVNQCFRFQHPEAFERPEVPEGVVPSELRYGRDGTDQVAQGPSIPEEPMGDPGANSWMAADYGGYVG